MHHHDIIDVVAGAGNARVKFFELAGRGIKGNGFDPGHRRSPMVLRSVRRLHADYKTGSARTPRRKPVD